MEMQLHIDYFDIILYIITLLAFVTEKYSNQKDKIDFTEDSYSVKMFWKVYNDNVLKIFWFSLLAFIIKDEIALPVIEHFYPEFINITEKYKIDYALVPILVYLVCKWKFTKRQ
jgi:hypothetical protein